MLRPCPRRLTDGGVVLVGVSAGQDRLGLEHLDLAHAHGPQVATVGFRVALGQVGQLCGAHAQDRLQDSAHEGGLGRRPIREAPRAACASTVTAAPTHRHVVRHVADGHAGRSGWLGARRGRRGPLLQQHLAHLGRDGVPALGPPRLDQCDRVGCRCRVGCQRCRRGVQRGLVGRHGIGRLHVRDGDARLLQLLLEEEPLAADLLQRLKLGADAVQRRRRQLQRLRREWRGRRRGGGLCHLPLPPRLQHAPPPALDDGGRLAQHGQPPQLRRARPLHGEAVPRDGAPPQLHERGRVLQAAPAPVAHGHAPPRLDPDGSRCPRPLIGTRRQRRRRRRRWRCRRRLDGRHQLGGADAEHGEHGFLGGREAAHKDLGVLHVRHFGWSVDVRGGRCEGGGGRLLYRSLRMHPGPTCATYVGQRLLWLAAN